MSATPEKRARAARSRKARSAADREAAERAAIERIVAAAPPLTPEQIVKLRRIFADTVPTRDRVAPRRVA